MNSNTKKQEIPKKQEQIRTAEPFKKRDQSKESEVFIGQKNFMNYVTGVVMQLNSGCKEVTIKARGKYISRAVDVAEVVTNRFMQEAKIKDVKLGSDSFKGSNNREVRVSTIEIKISK